MSPSTTSVSDGWSQVVGQPEAVARLQAAVENPVHAYLFVGPSGAGKRAALRAFAGELFASSAHDAAEAERHRSLALAEHHPDLVVIEPQGQRFRGGRDSGGDESEAARAIREAWSSPVEVSRKVVALIDFHSANATAIGALLKTIEEPPASTIIVVLADHIPTEQSAIASRCMQIEFGQVAPDAIVGVLEAEGVSQQRAAEVVLLAGGDLTRARVLAHDERLHGRVAAWRDVPGRLDGTGAKVAAAVADLRAMIDDAMASLVADHDADLQRFDDEAERYGLKGVAGQRRALVDRHKRAQRKFRVDELRLGLATLAGVYRDSAVSAEPLVGPLAAVRSIQRVVEALEVNPNEALLLQALFLSLPPLPTRS